MTYKREENNAMILMYLNNGLVEMIVPSTIVPSRYILLVKPNQCLILLPDHFLFQGPAMVQIGGEEITHEFVHRSTE